MKKGLILAIILLITMSCVLSGCGNNKDSNTKGSHTKSNQSTVNKVLEDKTSQSNKDNVDNSANNDNSKVTENESKEADGGNQDKNNTAASQSNTAQDSDKGKKEEEKSDSKQKTKSEADTVDVDLTKLSATMVYSEVFSMMAVPQEYVGKTMKMEGLFAYYKDEQSGQDYFACIIQDATACCAQGIEFELEGNHKYPRDYPNIDELICVQGIFEEYEDHGLKFYRLAHAKMVK